MSRWRLERTADKGTERGLIMQRSVASLLLLSIAAVTLPTSTSATPARPPSRTLEYSHAAPRACSNLSQYVSIGGTAGFNTLVNPDFTTALLATGHVRLYEHGNAVAAAITGSPPSNPYAILNAIESVFAGTGPGEAELGWVGPNYFTLPAGSYPGYYQYQYVNSGLTPNAANVNVPYKPASAIKFDRKNIRKWEAWAGAGRSVGIMTMAPIVAPNLAWRHSPIFPPTRREYYDLNSSFYDLARFEASYGGAIAFDTPSDFFLAGGSGPGYQKFIEQAIRWGDANGLRTTVLVSPLSRKTFTEDTKEFVRVLVAHNAVPTEWAVDDYENTDPNDASAMGPDTRRNTTTEVGLWLATHAPVYVQASENERAVNGMICRLPGAPL
jgi:hypothetical protein